MMVRSFIILVVIHNQSLVNHSDILYIGMMYHERRGTYYWITMYTAAKDLDAMLQVTLYLILNHCYDNFNTVCRE